MAYATPVNLTALLPFAFTDLPGCPEALILQAAFVTLEDFCRETQVWREDLAAINLVAAQTDYAVTCPAHGILERVVSVEVNGVAIPQSSWEMVGRTTIRLKSAPGTSATGGLAIYAAMLPVLGATTMSAEVFNYWRDALVHGILWRRMVDAKKPWSDPASGMYHQRQYRNAVGDCKWNLMQGSTNAAIYATSSPI